jgi:hypothetical protein
MKRRSVTLFVAVVAAAMALQMPAWSAGRAKVLEFDTMAPVVPPFTGSANAIRGVNGGGLPWEIDRAKGELRTDGRLEVEVEGLVLVDEAPVPEALRGTNPAPNFVAVVSCLSGSDTTATTVNVATSPFPATSDGDSEIEARVTLPSPCVAPIVFVGPSATTWFAATGQA